MTRHRLIILLGILVGLMIWGPPSLRTRARALDTALASPFAFDAAALFRVGTWAVAGACVAVILCSHVLKGRPSVLARFIRVPAWSAYLLLGVVGVLSTLWSVAPFYTLYFAAQVVVTCLLVAVVANHSGATAVSHLLRIVFVTHVLWMVATVAIYAVAPDLVSAGSGLGTVRLHGGMLGGYGQPGVIAGVFFLSGALYPRSHAHRVWSLAGYLACWLFLFAAQTRTAIAVALLCALVLCLIRMTTGVRVVLGVSTVTVALVLMPLAQTRRVLDIASREGQGLDTLSGRTVAYEHLITVWADSPWVGFGYAAGTRDALVDFYSRTGLNIGSGHDVLSTMLVDLGVLGVVMVAVALVAAWVQFVRVLRVARVLEHRIMTGQLGCLLLSVTLTGLTGQGIAKASVLFVVVAVGLRLLHEQATRRSLQSTLSGLRQPVRDRGELVCPARTDVLADRR